jgi:hypothetical protein
MSNQGHPWSADEEVQLLQELSNNISISDVAHNHHRTPGAIRARCRVIAYKMYLDNIDINTIKMQTKLCERAIHEIIAKKEGTANKPVSKPSAEPVNTLQTDILAMKKDIAELKESVKEIVDMLKAIYDFEES